MRFGTQNAFLQLAGGQADRRTNDTERDDFLFLRRKFGKAIILRGAATGRRLVR